MTKFRKAALIMAVAAIPLAVSMTSSLSAAVDSTAHRTMLSKNEQSLVTLEKTQVQISRVKGDEGKNALAATYEQQQLAYVKSMLQQHDAAITDVTNNSRSPNSTAYNDAIARLNDFEMLAQRHEKRMDALSKNATALENGRSTSFWQSSAVRAISSYNPLAAVHDLLFPSAHAAIALTVYNACKKNSSGTVNTAACVAASAKALVDSAAAKSAFDSCWASHANVKLDWKRALLRTGCTLTLTVRLA